MAMLLVFACKDKPGTEAVPVAGKDSAVVVSGELLNGDSRDSALYKGPYTEYSVFGFKHFEVRIQSFYYYEENHDDYWKANFIIVRDSDKKVADTSMLGLEQEEGSIKGLKVRDMTDSLKFKSLLLWVSYAGNNEMTHDKIYAFDDGSLHDLLVPTENIRRLWKIDEHHLGAVIHRWDDILHLDYDYPATLDLETGAVLSHIPDTQVIKRRATLMKPVTVYKNQGKELSEPFNIRSGTTLLLDTFFFRAGVVRMRLPDSTPVFIMRDELSLTH